MADIVFRDRADAGQRLAVSLAHLKPRDPLVVALPRGGVPVAYEVARALDAQLELLFVRKLGAPGNPELGIGAVVDGADPQIVLNADIVRQLGIGADYVAAELARQLDEIARRRGVYLGVRAPIAMAGRTVIVIDDGVATGGTVKAALQGARRSGPERLVLALPIAPAEMLPELRGLCDALVCLSAPAHLRAVGAHYLDFAQTSDAEVVRLLDRARG